MVQRRVGQHHAELAQRRARRRPRRARRGARGASTIGRAGEVSSALGRRVELDQRARLGHAGDHQRERLVLAVLARAQPRDRALVVGAAGEVVAAQPLDGDDRARAQQARRRGHGVLPRPAPAPSSSRRAARRPGRRWAGRGSGGRAGRRTRPARGAHREGGHRRLRAVVGDAAHDREARAAVRAVDERVAVAAVGRVEQLGEAVGAGRGVGGDERVGVAAGGAGDDREAALAGGRHARGRHAPTRASGGARPASAATNRSTSARGALDLDLDPVHVVAHEAGQAVLLGQAEDERAGTRRPARRPRPARRAGSRRPRSCRRAQRVQDAGLRLLDPRDVLGARRRRRGRRGPRRGSARRRSRRARSSPGLGGGPGASAAITFGDPPLVEIASTTSPGGRRR